MRNFQFKDLKKKKKLSLNKLSLTISTWIWNLFLDYSPVYVEPYTI